MTDRLYRFADRLRNEPGFIAYSLRHLTVAEVAAPLGIDESNAVRLLLCRLPRDDAEVERIAVYAGTDPRALARLLDITML